MNPISEILIRLCLIIGQAQYNDLSKELLVFEIQNPEEGVIANGLVQTEVVSSCIFFTISSLKKIEPSG